MSEYQQFSVYGFSVNYPSGCRVEFNPKSKEHEGDVVFHFADKTKIFLSWGELEKALGNFQTVKGHAEHSLEKVRKSGNVKNFQKISEDTVNLNSHKAAFNIVGLEEVTLGLLSGRQTSPRRAYSIHVHCENSARYFVIYGIFHAEVAEDYGKIILSMSSSLNCH